MRVSVLVCLLFSFASLSAFGAVNHWTTNGPNGGAFTDFVFPPGDANVTYASGDLWDGYSGLYRSRDGGNTWQPVIWQKEALGGILRIDPSNRKRYGLVWGGFQISMDAGTSWQEVDTKFPNPGYFLGADDFAFAPSNSQLVYAVDSVGDDDAVFNTSEDGGKTWKQEAILAHARLPGADLAVHPQNGNLLYVILGNGLVYQSTNGGKSWHLRSTGLPGVQKGVHGLAIDESNPQILYTAGFEGVYKTTNGGANWFSTDCGCHARQIAIDPSNEKILYAVGRADPGFDQAVKSIDGGKTWMPLSLPRFESHPYTAVAVDPRNPRVVLAASEIRGIFRSTDAGQTWVSSSRGSRLSSIGVSADPGHPGHLFVVERGDVERGGTAPGISGVVFETTDGGISWRSLPALDRFGVVLINVHPKDPSIVGAFGHSRLLSTDGGVTWQNRPALGIEFDPTRPGTSYDYYFDVKKSTDFGRTWSVSKPPLIYQEFITDLTVDARNGSTIYISTICSKDQDCIGPSRVFKSTDAGATWKDVSGNGLIGTAALWGIEVNPQNPSIVYVTGFPGFFRSNNGGKSWSQLSTSERDDLTIDPSNPRRLLSTDSRHIYISNDSGNTWQQFDETGLLSVGTSSVSPASIISNVIFSPWDPRTFFAAVDGIKSYTQQ
jgi:photosystem II stability/assembly factor-like uncharacterized protein